jgi:hypothetical protein
MATVTIRLVDEGEGVSVYMDCDRDVAATGLSPAMLMGGSLAEFVTLLNDRKNAMPQLQNENRCH